LQCVVRARRSLIRFARLESRVAATCLGALGLLCFVSCSDASEPPPARATSGGSADAGASGAAVAGVSGADGTSTNAGGAGVATSSGGSSAASGASNRGAFGGAQGSTSGAGGAGLGGASGTSSAAAGAGTAGCSGLFCEDFESGKIDSAIWDTQANGGQTVEVQTDTVAHGKYAVRFHGAPNVVSYDFIITKHAPAALSGHHYGRAYFYVTPKPPQEHTEFIFAGSAGFPKLKYLEVAESQLGWQLTFVQLVSPTGETYTPATGKVPLVKWVCLEWEMNDTPDQINVSVDGTPQVSFDDIGFMGKNSDLVGGFTDFGLGFYIWHPASYDFDVYYDDFVLDTKPIGCITP
jgi:hypothetical protein